MASVKQLENGRYQARFRDEARREHARNFRLKRDAQRWLDEQTAAIVSGQWADPRAGKITLANYFQDWSVRQLWASGTLETAQLTINSVSFKDMPIRSVRRSHIETWIKEMQTGSGGRKPFAASTIAVRFNHLHHVFRAAVADRIIPVDPAENVRVPRRRRVEKSMQIPTVDEVRAAMGAAEAFFRPAIALAAFAGLRRGELAGLQLGDVDFLRRIVSVNRQVQRGAGGRGDVRPPKHGSERDVYVPEDLVTLLSTVTPYAGGWLLPGKDGPPGPHMLDNWWSAAVKAAGITRAIRLHDLRHFYASGLIAAGCDVVTVQRAMGHTSATTTLTIYSHLWPTAEDRTRTAAAGLMREVADDLRTIGPRQAAD